MDYYARFTNSITKAPIAGLTLTWTFIVKASDGTAFTPQPSFTEIGNGLYKFTVSPTQDLLGRIDGGAALATQDRYSDVALSPNDANVAQSGDAYARLGAPGGASVSADIATVSAKTANLPASPAAVGSNMGTVSSVTDPVTVGTNNDKTGYALTAGEHSTLVAAIEGSLLNDTDGQALLQAIVDKINATDVDLAGLSVSAIATAVASGILATPGNKLDTDSQGRVMVGGPVQLDSAQRVKLAASQPDYAPALPTDVSTSTAAILAAIPDAPDNTGITAIITTLQSATYGLTRLDTEIDGIVTSLESMAANADIQILLSRIPGGVALDSDMQTLIGRISGAVPQLAAIVSGILDAAAAAHNIEGTIGAKINLEAAPVIIPLITGTSSNIVLTNNTKITIKRGDTYRLVFSLGRDCTNWTAWFGAKKRSIQTTYDMALRLVNYSDQGAGTGYIDLSASDTALAGTYYGELELRNGISRNTPECYIFTIVDDIVR